MTLPACTKALLGAATAALLTSGCSYDTNSIATRCESRVEASVNPAALQTWATNLLSQYSLAKTNYGGPFPVFPGLKDMCQEDKPRVSIMFRDSQEGEFVYVVWGSAAGHWGLSIGNTNFVPRSSAFGGRMWRSGIYFWRDMH